MSDVVMPTCPACNGEIEFLGIQSIRMGGASGGWVTFLGNLAESGEWLWEIGLFRCTNCGRFEIYDKEAPLTKRAKG